jgi:hypothetical protein
VGRHKRRVDSGGGGAVKKRIKKDCPNCNNAFVYFGSTKNKKDKCCSVNCAIAVTKKATNQKIEEVLK